MGKERATTLIERNADDVWATVRDFGDLSWFPHVESCTRDGDLRRIRMEGKTIDVVERVLSHDDEGRTYTYRLAEPLDLDSLGRPDLPPTLERLEATLTIEPNDASTSRVLYDVDADQAVVRSTRDGYQRAIDHLKAQLER